MCIWYIPLSTDLPPLTRHHLLAGVSAAGVRLQVESSVRGRLGWVQVAQAALPSLSLSCSLFARSSARPAAGPMPRVFWVKVRRGHRGKCGK